MMGTAELNEAADAVDREMGTFSVWLKRRDE